MHTYFTTEYTSISSHLQGVLFGQENYHATTSFQKYFTDGVIFSLQP